MIKDHPVTQERPDSLALTVYAVHQGLWVLLDLREQKDNRDPKEILEILELWVRLDQPDLVGRLDVVDRRVYKEKQDRGEPRDNREISAVLGHPDRRECRDLKENWDPEDQLDLKVMTVHQDYKENLDPKGLRDLKVLKETQDLLDFREKEAKRVLKALKVNQVLMDLKAVLDLPAHRVQLDHLENRARLVCPAALVQRDPQELKAALVLLVKRVTLALRVFLGSQDRVDPLDRQGQKDNAE